MDYQINIKTMKRIITLLLLTLSVYGAFSQDVITYKNGKTQKVVVLTTNDNDITCQDFESKEQFTISRSLIESVVYQAGKTEPFGVVLAKPVKSVPMVDNVIVQTQDTIQYQRGGGILYKGVQYAKPNAIASILLKQPNPEIAGYLETFKSNRGAANVLSFIGGFGMGWPIGGAIRGEKFNTGLFLGGVGVAAFGIGVFGSSAIKALKKADSSYNNRIKENKISLSPIFYQDNNQQSNVGFVIGF
jgi:hypothetical protein